MLLVKFKMLFVISMLLHHVVSNPIKSNISDITFIDWLIFFPITSLLPPLFIFPYHCFFLYNYLSCLSRHLSILILKKVDYKDQRKTSHLLNLDDSMLLTRCSFLDVWMILKTSLPGSFVGTQFRWFLSLPHWQVCGIVLAGCSPGPCISNLMMYSSNTAILFSNNRRSTFVTKHFDVKIQHWKSFFFFSLSGLQPYSCLSL